MRGRKPDKLVVCFNIPVVEIYPHEGTETIGAVKGILGIEVEIIPVRGLKRVT